jgi:flagellar FliJ protein
MARFVFKLRAVLKQRRWVERQRQRELASAQRAVQDAEDELARLQQEVRDANEFARQSLAVGRVNVGLLAQHRLYLVAAGKRMQDAARRIDVARQEMLAAQQRLVDATKQRRVIEMLRDRQLQQWKAEQDRRELALLDEAGTQIAMARLAEADASP